MLDNAQMTTHAKHSNETMMGDKLKGAEAIMGGKTHIQLNK
jgi:hypothetical protein